MVEAELRGLTNHGDGSILLFSLKWDRKGENDYGP